MRLLRVLVVLSVLSVSLPLVGLTKQPPASAFVPPPAIPVATSVARTVVLPVARAVCNKACRAAVAESTRTGARTIACLAFEAASCSVPWQNDAEVASNSDQLQQGNGRQWSATYWQSQARIAPTDACSTYPGSQQKVCLTQSYGALTISWSGMAIGGSGTYDRNPYFSTGCGHRTRTVVPANTSAGSVTIIDPYWAEFDGCAKGAWDFGIGAPGDTLVAREVAPPGTTAWSTRRAKTRCVRVRRSADARAAPGRRSSSPARTRRTASLRRPVLPKHRPARHLTPTPTVVGFGRATRWRLDRSSQPRAARLPRSRRTFSDRTVRPTPTSRPTRRRPCSAIPGLCREPSRFP